MSDSVLLVGAHVVCYVNAAPFGRVSGISLSMDTPKKTQHTIDTLLPVELEPLCVEVYGSMTIFKLKRDGGVEGVGLISKWTNLTFEKYFDLALRDRSTDSIIFHLEDCSVTSQRWTIANKGYVIGNVGFSGLMWKN